MLIVGLVILAANLLVRLAGKEAIKVLDVEIPVVWVPLLMIPITIAHLYTAISFNLWVRSVLVQQASKTTLLCLLQPAALHALMSVSGGTVVVFLYATIAGIGLFGEWAADRLLGRRRGLLYVALLASGLWAAAAMMLTSMITAADPLVAGAGVLGIALLQHGRVLRQGYADDGSIGLALRGQPMPSLRTALADMICRPRPPTPVRSTAGATVLLLITLAYLAVELAFSAHVLNLSGSIVSDDAIRGVQQWGGLISGLAFSLLVWRAIGLPLTRRRDYGRMGHGVSLLLCTVICVYAAGFVQTRFIERTINLTDMMVGRAASLVMTARDEYLQSRPQIDRSTRHFG